MRMESQAFFARWVIQKTLTFSGNWLDRRSASSAIVESGRYTESTSVSQAFQSRLARFFTAASALSVSR